MAEQQMDLESGLTISGKDLADAIYPALLANTDFINGLASNQAFMAALVRNPTFVKAANKIGGDAAGAVVVAGLTR